MEVSGNFFPSFPSFFPSTHSNSIGQIPRADDTVIDYIHGKCCSLLCDSCSDPLHIETGLAQILGKLCVHLDWQQRLTSSTVPGTIPGMHMVDIFTWLEYLPLCLKPWERAARNRFKQDLEWCMARLEVWLCCFKNAASVQLLLTLNSVFRDLRAPNLRGNTCLTPFFPPFFGRSIRAASPPRKKRHIWHFNSSSALQIR